MHHHPRGINCMKTQRIQALWICWLPVLPSVLPRPSAPYDCMKHHLTNRCNPPGSPLEMSGFSSFQRSRETPSRFTNIPYGEFYKSLLPEPSLCRRSSPVDFYLFFGTFLTHNIHSMFQSEASLWCKKVYKRRCIQIHPYCRTHTDSLCICLTPSDSTISSNNHEIGRVLCS